MTQCITITNEDYNKISSIFSKYNLNISKLTAQKLISMIMTEKKVIFNGSNLPSERDLLNFYYNHNAFQKEVIPVKSYIKLNKQEEIMQLRDTNTYEAIKYLATKDSMYKPLFELLSKESFKDYFSAIDFNIISPERYSGFYDNPRHRGFGYGRYEAVSSYSKGGNGVITINGNYSYSSMEGIYHTLAEEIIHAATVNALNWEENSDIKKGFEQIIKVYNSYSKDKFFKRFEGDNYVEEFIAAVFHHPEFAQRLNEIRDEKSKTFWEKIKDYFNRIFNSIFKKMSGEEVKDDSLLARFGSGLQFLFDNIENKGIVKLAGKTYNKNKDSAENAIERIKEILQNYGIKINQNQNKSIIKEEGNYSANPHIIYEEFINNSFNKTQEGIYPLSFFLGNLSRKQIFKNVFDYVNLLINKEDALENISEELPYEERQNIATVQALISSGRLQGDAQDLLQSYKFINSINTLDNVYTPKQQRQISKSIFNMFERKVQAILESELTDYQDKIEKAENENERKRYQRIYNKLSSANIIQYRGVDTILQTIKNDLITAYSKEKYLIDAIGNYTTDKQERIQLYREVISKENIQDADIPEYLKRTVLYNKENYENIISNFDTIKLYTYQSIKYIYGGNLKITNNPINELDEQGKEDIDKETQTNESFKVNFLTVSAYDNLTEKVRKILFNIPEYRYNGYSYEPMIDILDYPLHINSSVAYKIILDTIYDSYDINDMMFKLEQLSNRKDGNYYWVKYVIDKLNNDEDLQKHFYKNFRKTFQNYVIQTVKNGVLISQPANKSVGGKFKALDIQNNIVTGQQFAGEETVYNEEGIIEVERLDNIYLKVNELLSDYIQQGDSVEALWEFLNNEKNRNKLELCFKSVGILFDMEQLIYNLKQQADPQKVFSEILERLSHITNSSSYYNKNKNEFELNKLWENNVGAFTRIANLVIDQEATSLDPSVRQQNKTYYGYTESSYFDQVIRNLKNLYRSTPENNRGIDYHQKAIEYVEKHFLNVPFFSVLKKNKPYILSRWIRQLVENSEEGQDLRDNLKINTILSHNRKDFNDLDDIERVLLQLAEYFKDGNKDDAKYANFVLPVLGDASQPRSITFKRINDTVQDGRIITVKEQIIQELINTVIQEINRINQAKQIEGLDIANYKKNALQFVFFPQLNKTIKEILSNEEIESLGLNNNKNKTVLELDSKEKTKVLLQFFDNYLIEGYKNWDNKQRERGLYDSSKFAAIKPTLGNLENFYYNYVFAQTQLPQLLITDLAFVKDPIDYQKRLKATINGTSSSDTSPYFSDKVNNIKRNNEMAVITLSDVKVDTNTFLNSVGVIKALKRNSKLSDIDIRNILSKFKGITATDGQSFVTLDFIKKIMQSDGEWTDMMQQSYDNLVSGNWDMNDFDQFYQARKAMYNGTNVHEYTLKDGTKTTIRVPSYHKYSEYVLLAMYRAFSQTVLGENSSMSAINKFMVKNNIDLCMFESAGKTGNQKVVDISGFEELSEDEKETFLNDKILKTNQIKLVNMENYGMQQSNPEHLYDNHRELSTQLKRAIISNIPEDAEFTLQNGQTINKQQFVELYYATLLSEKIDNYTANYDKLIDMNAMSKELISQALSDKESSIDDIKKLTYNPSTGNFAIPVGEPLSGSKFMAKYASLIRNKVIPNSTEGGSVVQVSNFGFIKDKNLQVKYKEGKDKSIENIEYIGCYMPMYTKKLFEKYMDDEGNVDINKMPDNIKKLVGYRLPFEDFYSLLPLKIVDFLPESSGSSIIMPTELLALTGSDFDIDKLYLVVPQLNDEGDRKEYKIDLKDLSGSVLNMTKGQRNNLLLDLIYSRATHPTSLERMLNGGEFEDLKTASLLTQILKIPNIDNILMEKWNISKASHLYRKLYSLNQEELRNILNEYKESIDWFNPETFIYFNNLNHSAAVAIATFANAKSNAHLLPDYIPHEPLSINMGKEKIDKVLSESKNPKMIIKTKDGEVPYWFTITETVDRDGKLDSKTHIFSEINIPESLDISKYKNTVHALAELISAAVDAVKDPVLSFLNLTKELNIIAPMLIRLGMSDKMMGLFMTQPVIEHIIQKASVNSRLNINQIIADVLQNINSKIAQIESQNPQNDNRNVFMDTESMMSHVGKTKELEQLLENSNEQKKNIYQEDNLINSSDNLFFLKKQLNVLYVFKNIYEKAKILNEYAVTHKPDSKSSMAKGSLFDNIAKKVRKENLVKELGKHFANIPILQDTFNKDIITPPSKVAGNNYGKQMKKYKEQMLKYFMKQDLPLIQMDYTLGILAPIYFNINRFPQLRNQFSYIVDEISKQSKNNLLSRQYAEQVYKMYYTYLLSEPTNGLLGGKEIKPAFLDQTLNTYEDKRRYYLNSFIKHLQEYKRAKVNKLPADRRNARNSSFIKLLAPYNKGIILKGQGTARVDKRDMLNADWANLMKSDVEFERNLARDIFIYELFKNGAGYTPNGILQYAPMEVISGIEGYTDVALDNSILDNIENDDTSEEFLNIYVRNNLRAFAQVIPESENHYFKDANGYKPTLNTENLSTTFYNSEYKSKYIQMGQGNNAVFYKLNYDIDSFTGDIIDRGYEKITPLNIQYQYGNPNAAAIDNTLKQAGQSSLSTMNEEELSMLAGMNDPFEDTNMMEQLFTMQAMEDSLLREQATQPIELPENNTKEVDKISDKIDKLLGNNTKIVTSLEEVEKLKEIKTKKVTLEIQPFVQDGKVLFKIIPVQRGIQNSLYFSVKLGELQNAIIATNKLMEFASKNGISVEQQLQKDLNANGTVTFINDTSSKIKAIVQIAKESNLEQFINRLSEELSHAAIAFSSNESYINEILSPLQNDIEMVKEILGDEYDKYHQIYNGNERYLAIEALGKIVGEATGGLVSQGQNIKGSVIGRIISIIKNKFRGLSEEQLVIISQIFKDDSPIVKDMINNLLGEINGTLASEMMEDIPMQMYQLSQKLSIQEQKHNLAVKTINDLIDAETKRLHIIRNTKSSDIQDTQDLNRLITARNSQKAVQGIYKHMEELNNVLRGYLVILKDLIKNPEDNDNAKKLKNIRDTLIAYQKQIDIIRDYDMELEGLNDEEKSEINEELKGIITECEEMLKRSFNLWKKVSKAKFMSFVSKIVPENVIKIMNKIDNSEKTLEDYVFNADKDISFYDRWLRAAGDSRDFMIRLYDDILKRAQIKRVHKSLEYKKQITALQLELEESTGSSDTSWMYEKNAKGEIIGFIRELDYTKYEKERREAILNIYQSTDNPETISKLIDQWLQNNTELNKEGVSVPKHSLYGNPVFDNLSESQKKYYKSIISLKKFMDATMKFEPTQYYKPIYISNTMTQRLKNAKNVQDVKDIMTNWYETSIGIRKDDTDYNKAVSVIKDFEGNVVQTLPKFFTSPLENLKDVSTDVTSAMIAYADTAINFEVMEETVSEMELGRIVLRDRKISETKDNKQLINKIKVSGFNLVQKVFKKTSKSNFEARLDDFMEMNVYNHYYKDEGKVGQLLNTLGTITAINSLGFNAIAGLSNLFTGGAMFNIEALSNNHFKPKHGIKADNIFFKNAFALIGDAGKRVKTSKIALFLEHFNVYQDYTENIKDSNTGTKNWLLRNTSLDSMFIYNKLGETWLQARVPLALAVATELIDKKGNKVSLWDALEVVETKNNDGKVISSKLKFKDEYEGLDGKTPDEVIAEVMRKGNKINNNLNGIYHKQDIYAAQKYSVVRMGFMFRKFILPAFEYRFKGQVYNFDLNDATEGFYHTIWRLRKDIYKNRTNLLTYYNTLEDYEKASIHKVTIELLQIFMIWIAIGFMGGKGDDDDEKAYLTRLAELQLRRLYTETSVFTPSPAMLNEGQRILKSPAASVNTLDNILGLLELFDPSSYTNELKSGRYKGHSRAYRAIDRNIPFKRHINNIVNPELLLPFYQQEY